jgi:hypothetical protein
MIELLLPCGFDTLEYSWVKATNGICTLADYSMARKLTPIDATCTIRATPPPVWRPDWKTLAKLTSTRSKSLDLDACPTLSSSPHRFCRATDKP